MRTLVVLLFWIFVASVAVKAQRMERRRGRRPSQRITDGIQMLQSVMESMGNSVSGGLHSDEHHLD